MEVVEQQYKDTKIGKIPVEWEVVKQGDVATFHNGRAYKISEWEDSGIPVIRLQNLTGTGKKYYYSNLDLPAKQYCHKGDLLYMWSGSFGAYFWQGEKAIYHYHIWKIECQGSKLNKLFEYFLLDKITKRMKSQSQGLAIMHITKGGMEDLKIPLPPLPEQKKIAAILSTVDEQIATTTAIIQQSQQLKKGLMQQLFSKGIGHTTFKKTKIGEIPESWEVVKLEEITKSKSYGPRFSGSDYNKNGNVKTIRGTDFSKNGTILYNQVPTALLNKKLIETHKLLENDLIVVTTADCGLSAVFKEQETPFIPSAYTVRFRLNNKISPDYLRLLMLSNKMMSQVVKYIRKGTVANLAASDILKMYLPLPTLNEQKKIAAILTEVDDKIQAEQQQKARLEELKKGLMQVLLTGQVRVKT